MKKWIGVFLAMALLLPLGACGAKGAAPSTDAQDAASSNDAPANATSPDASGELDKKIEEKIAEINAVLEGNAELWNRLIEKMDTQPNLIYDGKVYSQYLSEALDANRDLFSEEELQALKKDIEQIKKLEDELAVLDEELARSIGARDTSQKAFPAFAGRDLDGKKVDSGLFANNAVTVVNFWFSSCQACVAELDKLDELNQTLQGQGGAVIGFNTDTFGGDEKAIAEAKGILEKKSARYQNVWVETGSDLANLTHGFAGYPITFVVDRNGNVVGEPVLGGIDNPAVMELLQAQIDTALQQDKLS